MAKTFKGRTADAAVSFLPSDFWKPGVKLIGKVTRTFDTENGPCAVLELPEPVQVNGEPHDEVAIGALKGLLMALGVAGVQWFVPGDSVYLQCAGVTPTTKGHDRADFEVEIHRP